MTEASFKPVLNQQQNRQKLKLFNPLTLLRRDLRLSAWTFLVNTPCVLKTDVYASASEGQPIGPQSFCLLSFLFIYGFLGGFEIPRSTCKFLYLLILKVSVSYCFTYFQDLILSALTFLSFHNEFFHHYDLFIFSLGNISCFNVYSV